MFQIGITNYPVIRLKQHRSKGWKLIELSKPMAGIEARNFETLILRALKDQGADLGNIKVAGKFDGYTEAWTKKTFTSKSIKELIALGKKYERTR